MKKLLLEISVIIVGSILLAFAFNYMRTKPLPLIYTPKKQIGFSEEELFGVSQGADILQTINEQTTNNLEKNEMPVADTTKIIVENKELVAKNNELKSNIGEEKTVTYEQMLRIINNSDFFLIDARSEENYKKSHIGNAINIFPYDNEEKIIPKIMELPTNKKIVVYCDGGQCDSSHELKKMLINFGFNNVYIYSGGWEEWSVKYGK